ncbi:sugar phosphate isomerase/epimerase [Streptomyces sp. HNM0574]|uniref:sugar phosphate isomerase/epimerase family protein n=1 Tax=Streptomyces sp. HNM0574 TaxID=2714954 RepID=UPI00146F6752|nr:sugar phosphate isomerase/epimerase [Streptomyces sp. HNM0574]NLU71019.1 sugar phosphate isomerase/epimerase [Streptomyces sp. HNM0574]
MTLRTAGFAARAGAAASAGFDGIGLRIGDYREARRQGWSDRDMQDLLERHGLRVTEVELLRSWWTRPTAESVAEEDDAFRIARLFGAERVNAGLPDGTAETDLVREYARLCARAERDGLLVPLEFMPYGAVTSLAQANRIVEEAGSPNGGLLVDTWHCHRTGVRPADLAALPPERVLSVQICDAPAAPHQDLRHEARHLRLLPGRGAADISGLLRALGGCPRVTGVSVEVMSDALDALPPHTTAALARSAAQGVLTESDWI